MYKVPILTSVRGIKQILSRKYVSCTHVLKIYWAWEFEREKNRCNEILSFISISLSRWLSSTKKIICCCSLESKGKAMLFCFYVWISIMHVLDCNHFCLDHKFFQLILSSSIAYASSIEETIINSLQRQSIFSTNSRFDFPQQHRSSRFFMQFAFLIMRCWWRAFAIFWSFPLLFDSMDKFPFNDHHVY